MAIFKITSQVTFDDIDSNLNLTNTALMQYLIDAAGMHSEKARIWNNIV